MEKDQHDTHLENVLNQVIGEQRPLWEAQKHLARLAQQLGSHLSYENHTLSAHVRRDLTL